MKVLTVRQPYASLIVDGIKDVENRSRNTNFRGRVLIHASLKPDKVNFEIDGQVSSKEIQMSAALNHAEENDLFGCIIGSVEIVGCLNLNRNGKESKSEWAHSGKYHWILRNPIKFEHPVYVKGKLGFWNFMQDVQ